MLRTVELYNILRVLALGKANSLSLAIDYLPCKISHVLIVMSNGVVILHVLFRKPY